MFRGRACRVSERKQRIVSLTCSNTEIVAALGCGDQLVGVDDYSDFPTEVVSSLPRVGPDLGIDVDAVVALRPDLVLASLTVPGHEAVVESIRAAGLRSIAPSPESLSDICRDIEEIAELLGVSERGHSLVEEFRRGTEPNPTSRGLEGAVRPKIAVQWWPKPPILPGKASWVHELIQRAGGCNPIGEEPVKSRPVPLEEFAQLNPDLIVISWCGVDNEKIRTEVVTDQPALREVSAVRSGRVVVIPEAFLGRPSPRLVEGYRALCALVDEVSGDA